MNHVFGVPAAAGDADGNTALTLHLSSIRLLVTRVQAVKKVAETLNKAAVSSFLYF